MDIVLHYANRYIVDPYILKEESPVSDDDYSVKRQFLVMWGFLYFGALFVYFAMACCTYFMFFIERDSEKHRNNPGGNAAWWKFDAVQVRWEIVTSIWSLAIMSGMTVPIELAVMYKKIGFVYDSIDDYGWTYLLLSPFLFVAFTDCLIYFIHRGLHWGPFYAIHKMHHNYKNTTPFSAFAFHPLDGYAQGLPYHLFVLVLPMHNVMYAVTLSIVGLWTINIHDRMSLHLYGVNDAAHHTIHHTKFNYNYGQYFIFWDWLCGTYMDPFKVAPYTLMEEAEKERELTQKKLA